MTLVDSLPLPLNVILVMFSSAIVESRTCSPSIRMKVVSEREKILPLLAYSFRVLHGSDGQLDSGVVAGRT